MPLPPVLLLFRRGNAGAPPNGGGSPGGGEGEGREEGAGLVTTFLLKVYNLKLLGRTWKQKLFGCCSGHESMASSGEIWVRGGGEGRSPLVGNTLTGLSGLSQGRPGHKIGPTGLVLCGWLKKRERERERDRGYMSECLPMRIFHNPILK